MLQILENLVYGGISPKQQCLTSKVAKQSSAGNNAGGLS
jgi:hypothetical protein